MGYSRISPRAPGGPSNVHGPPNRPESLRSQTPPSLGYLIRFHAQNANKAGWDEGRRPRRPEPEAQVLDGPLLASPGQLPCPGPRAARRDRHIRPQSTESPDPCTATASIKAEQPHRLPCPSGPRQPHGKGMGGGNSLQPSRRMRRRQGSSGAKSTPPELKPCVTLSHATASR